MTPSPGTPGASVDPSNSHCMPTQMPSSGTPRSSAARTALRQSSPSARVRFEMADARDDDPAGLVEVRGRGGREEAGAEDAQRLADRGEVAGAVVDQRNHSSPLVLGSIFASLRSLAHATRSARANALKQASILW